ncbi:MAG: DJ-1/PfpI family protein, partial [Sphingobium sp.]
GVKHDKAGDRITPDMALDQVDPNAYDALLLPGGVANPDRLRMERKAIEVIRDFAHAEKPVAAICHGPWLLVEADVIRERTVTGWPSIRTDLSNAGGKVVDEQVATDGFLITSRKPDDIPAFTDALIEAIEAR